ncbi:hypothetical protein HMPREF0044_1505 [Gleimia coleocanis DSM 15436]|uniref:Efflux ABC transporter, permease protein n=1 Tax=Gleimia coleocanis DSM 15436 TaxID=525245 RepID=C0W252_9ACTO|nr:hypothetical protein [Gleimia coleocanis]EEH63266.1 hypothetical protein HMPREF0044_1505 [Gleimia coleocanis DSM 15436]
MKTLRTNLTILRRSRDKTTSLLTVIALALPHTVFLAVLGGVLMFKYRFDHPTNDLMKNGPHLGLAVFAAILLIIPALSMGAAAARLGLSRKAKTLATLRLVGISPAEARTAAVADTLLQALQGILTGSALYVVTLPVWTLLSFQDVQVTSSEMWMGVVQLTAAGLGMLILTALSALLAMQKVAITPLGVVKQNQTTRINKWSVTLTLVFFASWFLVAPFIMQGSVAAGLTVLLVFLSGNIALMNVIGVAAVTLLGRLIARVSRSASGMLAGRRLAADPKAVWRSFGALGLVAFLVGVLLPGMYSLFVLSDPSSADTEVTIIIHDLTLGLVLTMAISTVLAAISTAVQQAIRALDSASQRQALLRMGASKDFWVRARRAEVSYPAVIIIGGATLAGVAFASPVMSVGNILVAVAAAVLCALAALMLVLTAAETARLLEK